MRLCLACHGTRLAVLFDNASEFRIYDVEDEHIRPAGHLSPPDDLSSKVDSVVSCGANLLICGGISGCTLRLVSNKVEVMPWICGEIDTVLAAWQKNALEELAMPGCKGQCRLGGCGKGLGRKLGLARGRSIPPLQHLSSALAADTSSSKKSSTHVTRQKKSIQTLKEGNNMKLAISSQGSTLDSLVDPRFGRAKGFLIYDVTTKAVEYASNDQNLNIPQGAGIQTAQNVAKTGATAVITGNIGPKAFAALKQGNIAMYLVTGGTVAEAIEAYTKGELTPSDQANKPGHW